MTIRLAIYGSSDDLLEVEAFDVDANKQLGGEEYNGFEKPIAIRIMLKTDEDAPPVGLDVVAHYSPEPSSQGTWVIGVAPLEDTELPDWPMSIQRAPKTTAGDPAYTAVLTIDVPGEFSITEIGE